MSKKKKYTPFHSQNENYKHTCTFNLTTYIYIYTVDSRYLEFDGTMEKIRVNRSSTQEEL